MIRPWHLRKQPSIRTTFSAVLIHLEIADAGIVINSPWHPRPYEFPLDTILGASRAIFPLIQAPSQDRTGIFDSLIFFLPTRQVEVILAEMTALFGSDRPALLARELNKLH